MKPGYKTTEFWLTLLAVVLAAVLPFVGDYPPVAQVIGVGLSVLAALGYTSARTTTKNREIEK
jgi:hypothetical protein